jgi:hypothetical protein
VNQGVQGSSEALVPKWLTDNRHRPSGLVWSGEDTLCGGRGDPPSLVEKILSGGDIKVTKGAWQEPVSLCGESSGALRRDLVTGKQYSYVSASTTWTRGALVPTDTRG